MKKRKHNQVKNLTTHEHEILEDDLLDGNVNTS